MDELAKFFVEVLTIFQILVGDGDQAVHLILKYLCGENYSMSSFNDFWPNAYDSSKFPLGYFYLDIFLEKVIIW